MGEALTSKQQAVRDFIEAYRQREGQRGRALILDI